MSKRIGIIGGGAAGFFGALAVAEANPQYEVIIFEKAKQVLSKVRISGGGRCNVTHACFTPSELTRFYPRGHKELLGPFHRFQPKDTINWFEKRGVLLKTEEDGRMFPISDNSETIIQCFLSEMKRLKVKLEVESSIEKIENQAEGFLLKRRNKADIFCDKLLLATGSSNKLWEIVQEMGHTIEPPVPSLFTFHIDNFSLIDLAGLSVNGVKASLENSALTQMGPILITHWGFSGPAILKLSAWGARFLHDCQYKAKLKINWLPQQKHHEIKELLQEGKKVFNAKLIGNENPFNLPKNIWKKFTIDCVPSEKKWIALSNAEIEKICQKLQNDTYVINGKSTNKDEFVTCGGIKLEEVNFKTMESNLIPHLYFAGEVLNIDGVTGGFNFQNAWTTSWIAAQAMAK